jgi:uncharacterized metal-binding protein YceD (DUF177 family)
MVSLKEYDIKFSGLKPDTYSYEYVLDKAFFAHFEMSPITEAHIGVRVVLDKKPRFFTLVFDLSGTILLPCDRCGEDFNAILTAENTMLVKIESRAHDADDFEDDVIYVHEGEGLVNIADHLYEFAVLAMPLHPVHPSVNGIPECNPAVLQKLEELSGKGPAPDDEDIELLEI